MRMNRTCCAVLAGLAVVAGLPAAARAGCGDGGGTHAGTYSTPGGATITVDGGQVSLSGASLFVDFFRQPSSTNDWIDVDDNGFAGFDPYTFPFVQPLAINWYPESGLDTWWMFNYRSVGSVRGFNEFVDSQTCDAIPIRVPSEAGLFNGYEYATLGTANYAGANASGIPVVPCEIEGSFLDVPSAWAIQVPGTPNWNRTPLSAGYGLNPVPTSAGGRSELQTLSRTCGECLDVSAASSTGVPCVEDANCSGAATRECAIDLSACSADDDCRDYGTCTANVCDNPAGQPCTSDEDCLIADNGPCQSSEICDTTGGPVVSLNTNSSPDANTIFDYVAAWVQVAIITNRGTGLENVRFTDLQYLFTTGRLPTGENLMAATRDVGSGTRNAAMNSLGIDTSWGRGDNVGNRSDVSTTTLLGSSFQPTNNGGSGLMEDVVRYARLAVGYTGLSGSSRAVGDANAGRYEILNIEKNVDENNVVTTACAGQYVRPGIDTSLDNCDPCTGWQIAGAGSFVFRGNANANRDPADPKYEAGQPIDNQAVADYINNIFDSVESFEGSVLPGECKESGICSLSGADCALDDPNACNAGADGSCNPKGCSTDAQCSFVANDICKSKANMPGQYLAQTFFLPPGLDCLSGLDAPLAFRGQRQECSDGTPCDEDADCTGIGGETCDVVTVCNEIGECSLTGTPCTLPTQCSGGTNPADVCEPIVCSDDTDCAVGDTCQVAPANWLLQNFIRANNGLGVGGDTPAFGSKNVAGQVPKRNTALYSDGKTADYLYWNGSAYVAISSGKKLSARNRVQGDMNEDFVRNELDAAELVKAYRTPRAWQQTAAAIGSGATGGDMTADNAIPEVIADFDGDGNLSKEDLRYFMDGLAIDTGTGKLNRKDGAIALDNALIALAVDLPWAAQDLHLFVPPVPPADPTFNTPPAISTFLATPKPYAAGDFRGDVAGAAEAGLGRSPIPGAKPWGWDGKVDDRDICYCSSMAGLDWSDLDDAVHLDLSCDMDGDADVDTDDITELVEVILGTRFGDANWDRTVDGEDLTIVQDTIENDPTGCNAAGTCRWADGDFTCDGTVDGADLVFVVDYPAFAECMTGPVDLRTPECAFADFNGDNHVDLLDFAHLQR